MRLQLLLAGSEAPACLCSTCACAPCPAAAVLTPAFFVAGASYLLAPQAMGGGPWGGWTAGRLAGRGLHTSVGCAACSGVPPSLPLASCLRGACALQETPCQTYPRLTKCRPQPQRPRLPHPWEHALSVLQKTLGNLMGYFLKGDDSSEWVLRNDDDDGTFAAACLGRCCCISPAFAGTFEQQLQSRAVSKPAALAAHQRHAYQPVAGLGLQPPEGLWCAWRLCRAQP